MTRLSLPSRLGSFRHHRGAHSEAQTILPSRSTSPTRVNSNGAHHNGSLVLRTKVIKGRNLAPKDKHNTTSDPYLVLTLGDSRSTTAAISKNLNPEWNETIDLPIDGLHCLLLEVKCWDKDRFGKDYMGEFDVALEEAFTSGLVAQEPTWYSLQSRRKGKKKSVATGEVLLEFLLLDPLNTAATPHHLQQRLLAIVAASADGDEEDDDQALDRVDTQMLEDTDDDDEDESIDASVALDGSSKTSLNTPEATAQRRRRLRLAKIKKKAKQRAYEFSGLSDLAGVLFLEITKITDLPPERNMTRTSFDVDPFVVTSLGKKTYRTKVVRHNLNPIYNEKLVFQVLRHETQYSLSFTIIDRDSFSGNDLIGSVNFPIETVSSLAPEADPKTGLYTLSNPESFSPPMSEARKARFRLPLSRSSSSNSLSKINTNGKPGLTRTLSQQSLMGAPPQADHNLLRSPSNQTPQEEKRHDSSGSSHSTVTQDSHSSKHAPTGPASIDTSPDDPELKPFNVPINLKNKDRWQDKHQPTLHIRAKYLPYQALRQQFWRAMLKQYDADDSGRINKTEMTSMLDTLGSTLREATIDRLFQRSSHINEDGDLDLTIDQAVMALEGLLTSIEQNSKSKLEKSMEKLLWSPKRSRQDEEEDEDVDPLTPSISRSPTQTFDFGGPMNHPHHGAAGETGDTLDANDLSDDRGEEHVVEIRECPICHQPRLTKKSDADIITHIATCASQDWRQVNNIVMAGFVTSSQAGRKWYSKVVSRIGYGGYKLGRNSANILVQDRSTGLINEERMSVYVRLGIRLLYKGLKSGTMEKQRMRRLLRSLSFKQGRTYDNPASASEIQTFVNFHQLDMSEVLLPITEFKNFNEFFYRKLKPDARPCSAPDNPHIITSPADCRTVVFNRIEEAQSVWIKGREFTVQRLLGKAYPEDAKRYIGGAIGVFRLAPQDYHRFHIPVDGVMSEPKLIEGEYYTVNPMAVRSALDVYGENIRVIVPIDSVAHGRVMVVCVGAMMVGSTVITRQTGERVHRAEELGYFKFGGSTILLLFEPGVMRFDPDLVDNAKNAVETLVRVGMSIGHSPSTTPHRADMRKKDSDITPHEIQMARRRISGSFAPNVAGMGMSSYEPGPGMEEKLDEEDEDDDDDEDATEHGSGGQAGGGAVPHPTVAATMGMGG